ncbi:hypothetical protein CHFL109739_18605 [Chryseobacterium flavum]|nr:hypothetical protein [Chryseobacterium flavum]
MISKEDADLLQPAVPLAFIHFRNYRKLSDNRGASPKAHIKTNNSVVW